jgi:hypothetical protein
VVVHGICSENAYSCTGNGNHPNLWIYENTIASNLNIVQLADSYGHASSPPFLYSNIFYKIGNNANFLVWDDDNSSLEAKAISINDDCQNGADCEDDKNIDFAEVKEKELIFGYHIGVLPKDSGGMVIKDAAVSIQESDNDAVPSPRGSGTSDCKYFEGFIIEKRYSNIEGSGPTYEVSETPNGVNVSYGGTTCDEISVTVDGNKKLSVTLSSETSNCGTIGGGTTFK